MDQWYAITGRPCALSPFLCWSVDWQVRVHYEKPDGLVPGGAGDFFFTDRHVRPDVALNGELVTRGRIGMDAAVVGCAVSAATLRRRPGARHGGEMADHPGRSAHEADWDFLVERRDALLAAAGVRGDAGLREKADALALAFDTRAGYRCGPAASFTRGFHPVDTLLHGQHCTGQSAALAAMLHTLGVPARTLNFAGHSVCEACLDGCYVLYDNQVEEPRAGASFMQTAVDPGATRLTQRRRNQYHWLMNTAGQRFWTVTKGKWPNPVETSPFNHGAQQWWRFNASGAGAYWRALASEGGHGFTLPLTPETARALYPAEPSHHFKYNAGEPCRVALTLPHSWFAAPLLLNGRTSVRKIFWLGSLAGATAVTSLLAAWPGAAWRMFRPYAAGWRVRVNDRGWDCNGKDATAPRVSECHHGIEVTLPPGALRENALNEISLGSETETDEYTVLRAYPDLLEPYAPAASRPLAVAPETVAGAHVCDAYSAHVTS